jgi:hypothetical protein
MPHLPPLWRLLEILVFRRANEDIRAICKSSASVTPAASLTPSIIMPLVTPRPTPVIHEETSARPVMSSQPFDMPAQVYNGPMTRSHAKKLQQEMNSFLTEYEFIKNKNFILPKCSTYVLLRFTQKGGLLDQRRSVTPRTKWSVHGS